MVFRRNPLVMFLAVAGLAGLGYYAWKQAHDKGKEPPPATTKPGKGKTVYVDAGHGGEDPGAVFTGRYGDIGYIDNLEESQITLLVCKKVVKRLKDLGFAVAVTRDKDEGSDVVPTRQAKIRAASPNFVISVHVNGVERDDPKTTTGPCNREAIEDRTILFIANDKSAALAVAIADGIMAATNRKVEIQTKSFNILEHGLGCPSVLVELGFICHYDFQRFWLANRTWPIPAGPLAEDLFAQGIVGGIASCL